MPNSGAIAIFVKTPGLSPLKTRLGRGIGMEQAELFYLKSVQETKQSVSQIVGSHIELKPYWAVSEKESFNSELWQDFPLIWQGEGGLGEKLHQVYSSLLEAYNFVLIIGSDSPHLKPEILSDSAKQLEENQYDFTFGPTEDGGFYLFGGSKPLPQEFWTSVNYSKDQTATEFLNGLEQYGSIYHHPENFDIDTRDDLIRLAALDSAYQVYL